MQKINDIVGYKNRKIIQMEKMQSLSLDSLILSNFVAINRNVKNILDIGTGIGVIPLIISLRTSAHIDGVELQKELSEIADRNVKMNKLDKQISIICDDIKNFSCYKDINFYDVIVCNPPFFNDGKISSNKLKAQSRHEETIKLNEIFKISKKLLKNKGRFAIVFRVERLMEVLDLYYQNKIMPKKIVFIHHEKTKEAKLFFIEGIKNGMPGLKIEPPFVLYENDVETEEYKRILDEVK